MYLGIDGGASKTAGVIINEEGMLIASARVQGCALIGLPTQSNIDILNRIIDMLCLDASLKRNEIRHFGFGLNGIDFEDEIPFQKDALTKALNISPENLTLVNDGVVALWGATDSPWGLIIQMGSALTSALRDGFGTERPFDTLDVGKIFDIRRAAIEIAARMIDGRELVTDFKEAILNHLGIVNESKFAELIYRNQVSNRQLQTIAEVVYRMFELNDCAAQKLIETAVQDLVCLCRCMRRHIKSSRCTVVYGGGVLKRMPQRAWKMLEEYTQAEVAGVTVCRAKFNPEIGAAIMAAYSDGVCVEKIYRSVCSFNLNSAVGVDAKP